MRSCHCVDPATHNLHLGRGFIKPELVYTDSHNWKLHDKRWRCQWYGGAKLICGLIVYSQSEASGKRWWWYSIENGWCPFIALAVLYVAGYMVDSAKPLMWRDLCFIAVLPFWMLASYKCLFELPSQAARIAHTRYYVTQPQFNSWFLLTVWLAVFLVWSLTVLQDTNHLALCGHLALHAGTQYIVVTQVTHSSTLTKFQYALNKLWWQKTCMSIIFCCHRTTHMKQWPNLIFLADTKLSIDVSSNVNRTVIPSLEIWLTTKEWHEG